MATVFVARELGNLVLVTSSTGTTHRVVPFKDGSALVAWVGDDITPDMLDNLPSADMLLGSNHERAINVFAKMLRDTLDDAGLLRRLLGGIRLSTTEFVVATRSGVWRIDQAFQIHACMYVCIGDGARATEALFGEYVNSYKDSGVRSLIIHALHIARDYDKRMVGPYRFPKVELATPDPFLFPLQPKLNIRD
jgi:hypothetical protein